MTLFYEIISWLKDCKDADEILLQLLKGILFHSGLNRNESNAKLAVPILASFQSI